MKLTAQVVCKIWKISERVRSQALVCAFAWACFASQALAQGRPDETQLFGGSETKPNTDTLPPAAANATQAPAADRSGPSPSSRDARDDAVLGGAAPPMFSEKPAPSDPLTIGGQIYWRLQASAYEDTAPDRWGVTAPALLDVYLDARPNDRVRGYALGRMSYDPMQSPDGSGLNAQTLTNSDSGTAGSASIAPIYSGASNQPRVVLDQLWLRFDVGQRLFITAGKQHVRWGTARFWMPADFLHLRKRNPLDVFDVRTGTTMLKLHLPIESRAWNVYAYGIAENTGGRPDLRAAAGALRAEVVLGQLELGLGAFAKPRSSAKFAADVSFGVGDIDFYSELAVIDGRDIDRVRYTPDAMTPAPVQLTGATAQIADTLMLDTEAQLLLRQVQLETDALYPRYRSPGYRPQAVFGLNYTRKYNDKDTFTVGAEYFYNGLGYDNADAYSGLLWPHSQSLQNPASFFYLGKHYAALFITFPAPFDLDLHTFTFSTLGNLSDRSFTSRFDYGLVLLTHLRLEAYVQVAYGARGEFRLKIAELPSLSPEQLGFPNPSVVSVGAALRLAI